MKGIKLSLSDCVFAYPQKDDLVKLIDNIFVNIETDWDSAKTASLYDKLKCIFIAGKSLVGLAMENKDSPNDVEVKALDIFKNAILSANEPIEIVNPKTLDISRLDLDYGKINARDNSFINKIFPFLKTTGKTLNSKYRQAQDKALLTEGLRHMDILDNYNNQLNTVRANKARQGDAETSVNNLDEKEERVKISDSKI